MSPLEIGLLIALVTIVLLGTGMSIAFGLGFVALAFLVGFQGVDSLGVMAEKFFGGNASFALVSLPMQGPCHGILRIRPGTAGGHCNRAEKHGVFGPRTTFPFRNAYVKCRSAR